MSVLNQINSVNTSNKKAWTVEDVRLAIGLKALGATRAQIAEVTGHSANSVTYMMTRRFKTDEALAEFTGFTTLDEYKKHAQSTLEGDKSQEQTA